MNKIETIGWQLLCRIAPKKAVEVQYRHILGGVRLT